MPIEELYCPLAQFNVKELELTLGGLGEAVRTGAGQTAAPRTPGRGRAAAARAARRRDGPGHRSSAAPPQSRPTAAARARDRGCGSSARRHPTGNPRPTGWPRSARRARDAAGRPAIRARRSPAPLRHGIQVPRGHAAPFPDQQRGRSSCIRSQQSGSGRSRHQDGPAAAAAHDAGAARAIPIATNEAFTLSPALVRPTSRGTLRLRSARAEDSPKPRSAASR